MEVSGRRQTQLPGTYQQLQATNEREMVAMRTAQSRINHTYFYRVTIAKKAVRLSAASDHR